MIGGWWCRDWRGLQHYIQQMDDIAELKFCETLPFIKTGRIGDIGCAVGSWMKLACQDERFRESFYGIEVARHLYDICRQQKQRKFRIHLYSFHNEIQWRDWCSTEIPNEYNPFFFTHTKSESYGSPQLICYRLSKTDTRSWFSGDGSITDNGGAGEERRREIVLMKLNTSDGPLRWFWQSIFDSLAESSEDMSLTDVFFLCEWFFVRKKGYKLKFEESR